jgi:hypothetical protein
MMQNSKKLDKKNFEVQEDGGATLIGRQLLEQNRLD